MPKLEAVWAVVSNARVKGYGYEVLGCFVRKRDVTKFLRDWLPRRRWKYPEDSIDVYRFPQGFQPGWRTVEAPYQRVTHEFIRWDPNAINRATWEREGRWIVRERPLTTLGMVTDLEE